VVGCCAEQYFTVHDKTGKPVSLEKITNTGITSLVMKEEKSLATRSRAQNMETLLENYIEFKKIRDNFTSGCHHEVYHSEMRAIKATFGTPPPLKITGLCFTYLEKYEEILVDKGLSAILGIIGGTICGFAFGGVVGSMMGGGVGLGLGLYYERFVETKENETKRIKALTDEYNKLLQNIFKSPASP